jgi:sugar diacid utilization regulator
MIALPAFGPAVSWPRDAGSEGTRQALVDYAASLVAGRAAPEPGLVSATVPVRLGGEVLGVVGALGDGPGPADGGGWLEAAAAAAAVTALMGDGSAADAESARRALLASLELQEPSNPAALVTQGRRLGIDLSGGAVAIGAAHSDSASGTRAGSADPAVSAAGAGVLLLADVGEGRFLGLVPLVPGAENGAGPADVIDHLRDAGLRVAASAPQAEPAALHEAVREAAVLLELLLEPGAALTSHEETYRLLVGVLLRNPDELRRLRDRTVAALESYDAGHDTDLVATLEAFLAHHGSTTETAEAMGLHRHTVGYRLARVQEVSGLSPYETDGREQLSLGLKAQRILAAERRRAERAAGTVTLDPSAPRR